jgi:hypothetical protein
MAAYEVQVTIAIEVEASSSEEALQKYNAISGNDLFAQGDVIDTLVKLLGDDRRGPDVPEEIDLYTEGEYEALGKKWVGPTDAQISANAMVQAVNASRSACEPVGNPRELYGDELDAAQDAYERTHLGWD